MTILFASDLDRTLIYSKRSMGQEVDEQEHLAVEWIDENAAAYMTKKGISLFRSLASKVIFVPITSRTTHQYHRVTGLFTPSEKPKYAIVSNGAVILENGKPLEEWSNKIEKQLQQDCTSIEHVMPLLKPYVNKGFVSNIKKAESWFVYMIIDEKNFNGEDIEDLSQTFDKQGFTLSHQGRKIYLMPNCINKSTALQFVKERIGASTVIAAGDSLLDFDMVISADLGFFPSHGEVVRDKKLFPPHIIVTERTGVLAGEEILKEITNYLLLLKKV